MFFWLKYGNAEQKIVNLDCRCDILLDHFYRTCVAECIKFLAREEDRIQHATAELDANIANLEKLKSESTAVEETANVEAVAAAVSSEQNPTDFSALITELQEIRSTRAHQMDAINSPVCASTAKTILHSD